MADNLLDKASILLTPTAYDNGSMLSIKPENGDGDFTFSRSSAATRVNAQGLVENVQTISSELVSNGDFSQIGTEEVSNGNFSQEGAELITNGDFATDSDWNKESGWTISGGNLVATNVSGTACYQTGNGLVAGKTYRVKFEITEYTTGAVGLRAGTGAILQTFSSVGVHSADVVVSGALQVRFDVSGTTTLKIDNVSVKEVGQDWNLGSGWSIGEDKAVAVSSFDNLSQSGYSFVAGNSYKVTYEVLDYVNGNIIFQLTGGSTLNGDTRNTNGTFTQYVIATDNHTTFRLRGTNFTGSITNISVKEVGQDWTLGTGWSIGDDKASCDGSQSSQSNLYQAGIVPINNTYKVTFDIVVTSGSVYLSIGGSNAQPTVSSSGTYTFTSKATTGDSNLYFSTNSTFIGSITNISVKEITDDTDLPRINYEGFSYQDALGSEEVVNGDFSNGSANWENYTSGSSTIVFTDVATLNVDASNSNVGIYQENVFASGKQYKVVLRIKASSSFDAEVLETQGAATVSTIGSVS